MSIKAPIGLLGVVNAQHFRGQNLGIAYQRMQLTHYEVPFNAVDQLIHNVFNFWCGMGCTNHQIGAPAEENVPASVIDFGIYGDLSSRKLLIQLLNKILPGSSQLCLPS